MTAARLMPWVAIGTLMLMLRLVYVFAYPIAIGDASVYQEVARNILHNGCVSLSSSASALCLPHWGGNQLPGYPAFISGVWAVFGESNTAVRVAQAVLSSAALLYLAWASALWTNSRVIGLVLSAILAISPATLGWPRHMFTESLAIACSAFVFAEIIRSLADRNLRVVPLGLGLAVAVFIRIDLLSLCVPVAIAGFVIERPRKAVVKGAVIAAVMALPMLAWTIRSVGAGLSAVPDLVITSKGERFPVGFMAWGRTWATDQYQLGIWMYPVMRRQYTGILPPPEAFDNDQQASRVRTLLGQLKAIDGQAMPAEIDAAFGQIAMERAANAPLQQRLIVPLKRVAAMWANPASSTGLPLAEEILGPNDIKDARQRVKLLSRDGFTELISLIIKYPELLLYKGVSFAERMTIGLVAMALLAHCIFRPTVWSTLLCTAASFAATRMVVFAYFGVPSTRYIVEAMPALEAAIVISLLMWRRKCHGGARP